MGDKNIIIEHDSAGIPVLSENNTNKKNKKENLQDKFVDFYTKDFSKDDSSDDQDYRAVLEAMLGKAYKPMDEGALALVNLGAGIAKGDLGAGLLGATKAIGEERDRTRKDMVARATTAYYLGGGRGSKGTNDAVIFRQATTDVNKMYTPAVLAGEYKKRFGELPPDGQAAKAALAKFKDYLIQERAALLASLATQTGGSSFVPASSSDKNYTSDYEVISNARRIERSGE